MLSKPSWPLFTLSKKRSKINTEPDYQRPAVWTKAQKQLLIDSILRDYDVPKVYLHKTGNDTYDVIDGQQRIRAIWSFYDDEFALPKDADPVNGISVAGKKYSELDMDIAAIIDSYNIDFVVLENSNEDEIREMFLRLQNGTTLKAQEKRNAMPGRMRDFVKTVAQHEFFSKVAFSNKRYTFDHIAAQLCLLSITGKICNIKDRDLNEMYENYKDFDVSSTTAKAINRNLDYMNRMFPSISPELKRYNVISLYAVIMDLIPNYDIRERESEIAEWFIEFEKNREIHDNLPPEEQTSKLVIYHEHISHSTDTAESLNYRYELLKEDLFSKIPDLPQKDAKRIFDYAQRQVIYRRDKGICQICGKHCDWNEWEADHIIPWSRGGKTIITNGQVLCETCNSTKSDN